MPRLFAFLTLALTANLLAQQPQKQEPTAECYTNHAGSTLIATPEKWDEKSATVTFRKENDDTLTLPLSVFPKEEQDRILNKLKQPQLSPKLRAAHARHQATLQRLHALHTRGLLSKEEYHAQCERHQRIWEKRLQQK